MLNLKNIKVSNNINKDLGISFYPGVQTDELIKVIENIKGYYEIAYGFTLDPEENVVGMGYRSRYRDSSMFMICKNVDMKLLNYLYKLDHAELKRGVEYYIRKASGIRDAFDSMSEADKTFVMSLILGDNVPEQS